MKLTKEELKNILNAGWAERRAAMQERKERNKKTALEWMEREKLIKLGLKEPGSVPRRRDYRPDPPAAN